MHGIGIMQGRLSPWPEGKIQIFPKDTWEDEFPLASECGFDSIELTIDFEEYISHPLLTEEGRKKIVKLKDKWGLRVPVICCDIFMDAPFFGVSEAERQNNICILHEVIEASGLVGLKMIEIPVISRSAIKTCEDEELLVDTIWNSLPIAEKYDVRLLLETDLSPEKFRCLLERFGGKVLANYDTGNSTIFGFNQGEEIRTLGNFIGNVHIKDCKRDGYTVSLGAGDTPFDECFQALANIDYRGDFFLQTAREKDNMGAAKRFRSFTLDYIQRYLKQ